MLHVCFHKRWPVEVTVTACENLESLGLLDLLPQAQPGTDRTNLFEWARLDPETHAALRPAPALPVAPLEALPGVPPFTHALQDTRIRTAYSRKLVSCYQHMSKSRQEEAEVIDLTGRTPRPTKYGRCELCARAMKLVVLTSSVCFHTYSVCPD